MNKMEPCLRVQLKTEWCKITSNVAMIVWADAEKFALWEPVLPGMSRKYFGELPQKTLFARVYWAL